MEDALRKKAELILGGNVRLPQGFQPPFRLSKSTAGPGAGSSSMVFSFDGYRVKKTVSYEEGEYNLVNGETLSLWKDDIEFISSISIEPVGFHAPEQAFFTIDERCMFGCAFCTSPLLDESFSKKLTPEKTISMIENLDFNVKSIAFTSGVVDSVEETICRFIEFIETVRKKYSDIPIGVEPYVESVEQIQRLKDAGANEIKINVEAATESIFNKVCPDLNYSSIFEMLTLAVDIFGKGKVTSNLIYGLGETDEDIELILEKLSSIGVMTNLRPLRVGHLNKERLENALGKLTQTTVDRALVLRKIQEQAFKKYDLSPSSCKTMCFACGCCDLIPIVPTSL